MMTKKLWRNVANTFVYCKLNSHVVVKFLFSLLVVMAPTKMKFANAIHQVFSLAVRWNAPHTKTYSEFKGVTTKVPKSLLCREAWPSLGVWDEDSIVSERLLFSARGDLSLGDGQGVLKMVAVTYSRKASSCRKDRALCSVSKGLMLGMPTDKTTFSPWGGISFCKLGADDDPEMTAVLKRCAMVEPWAASSWRNLR